MRLRRASLAQATLLAAASVACVSAWSQTVQDIPLHSPKPKPPEKPKQINLEPPKEVDTVPKAQEVDSKAAPAKPGKPAQPKEIVEDAPPPDAPVKSFAPAPIYDPALERQLRDLALSSHTHVSLYAWQLNTSKAVAMNADQTVQTTDVVQLAMLWESLRQIALGNINWDDVLSPKASTLRDAASRMVLAGDATMPSLLVERFTPKRVDQDLTTFGYDGPWLKPAALKTTPRQMVRLLQHIGMCDLDLPMQLHVNAVRAEAACRMATSMLRDHLYFDTTPTSSTARTILLATKTGPVVVAIYIDGDPANNATQLLPSITQAIVTAWSPDGFDGTLLGKPHLGVSWE